DGIRDKLVTGVQTCALPILSGVRKVIGGNVRGIEAVQVGYTEDLGAANSRQVYVDALRGAHSVVECISIVQVSGRVRPDGSGPRSEERRVGKEGRAQWAGEQ